MTQGRGWVTHEWQVAVSAVLLKSTLEKYSGKVQEVGRKRSRDYSDLVIEIKIRAVDTEAISAFKYWIETHRLVTYEIHAFKPFPADKLEEFLWRFRVANLKSKSTREVNKRKFVHAFQVLVPSEKVAKAIAKALGGRYRRPA